MWTNRPRRMGKKCRNIISYKKKWRERRRKRQSIKREAFVLALLHNTTIRDAAKEAGIAEGTAYEYLNDPEFVKNYDAKRRELLTSSCHMLQAKMGRATEELIKVIEDPKTATQVRLNAIDMLFRHAYKQTEIMDILTRLDILEERTSR